MWHITGASCRASSALGRDAMLHQLPESKVQLQKQDKLNISYANLNHRVAGESLSNDDLYVIILYKSSARGVVVCCFCMEVAFRCISAMRSFYNVRLLYEAQKVVAA